MPVLYKYIEPDNGPGDIPKPLLVLRSLKLIAADPCGFNDPFEVRPWYDQERHDHGETTHDDFQKRLYGRGGEGLVGYPVDLAADFADDRHKRFRDEIAARFRVLCLSKSLSSVLMWSHYTRSHCGVVIGIETSDLGFRTGLRPEGFGVNYDSDRSRIKLPLAYYQSPWVERYDGRGNMLNNPNESVVSCAGLVIPFSVYRSQIEDAYMTALTTKAKDWHYEQEVRFIYDVRLNSGDLVDENGRYFVAIPATSIREIIIGFRAKPDLVEQIVEMYNKGEIGAPKLSYSECHPNRYEVSSHPADAEHLVDYFKYVRPSI